MIVLLGLGLRIAFLLKGTALLYHSPGLFAKTGDSFSYTLAFENLWYKGYYTFDFLEPDAAFGRLPGYPFFYGTHWVLFGREWAATATACSQVLLDTAAIGLVFAILQRLAPTRPHTAYLGALLYATYPFIIIWVPVIGTEALSTDLTLLWLWLLLRWRPTALYAMAVGALAALVLLVRAYLGILLPITLLWLLWLLWQARTNAWRLMIRQVGMIMLGFGLLYGGWPLRNYLLTQRLILLKPQAAGYANQTPDVDEFYQWVHCWTLNENPWLDSVLVGKGRVHFPGSAFGSVAEEEQAQRLVARARQCGSGFWVLRSGICAGPYYYQNPAAILADTAYQRHHFQQCNAEIGNGFKELRQRFAAEHPFRFWMDVPLQNLEKAVFKSTLATAPVLENRAAPPQSGLIRLAFGYRTVLLLLGWGGVFVGVRRQPALWLIAAVAGFMYVYICFVYRGLEIRYLLQADVLLLIPAALWLGRWWPAALPKPKHSASRLLPA